MSNKIKYLRKINKLSQSELAVAVKVSRPTISSLENGKTEPTLKVAFRIARFFNVSVDSLFNKRGGFNG